MAKKRMRPPIAGVNKDRYGEAANAPTFWSFEESLHKFFRKSPDEARAGLSSSDWLIYLGILAAILIMPFLYSRATTENFLTPKEFFSKIIFAALGGMYFARLFLRRKILMARTNLDLPLALFFGFSVFSVLWNYNMPSAIRDLRGVLSILLLYPLVVNVVRSRWQVELILWVVIFTGLATSMIGIMETYNFYFRFDATGITYAKDEVLRGYIASEAYYLPLFPQLASPQAAMQSVVSTFGNRNYLGTFAMFTAFLPLAFFFYYRNLGMKIFSLGLYAWMLYGLYITRCRAALIGIAFGIVYMVIMLLLNDRNLKLMRKNARFFLSAVFIIFAVLFVVSVVTIQSTNIFDKIKTTFTLDREVGNTYERMWVWHGTIKAFDKSPVSWMFGRGFGSFKHFFPYQEAETFSDANKESFTAVTFRQAHNDWLQVMSELGIIGLVLFLFLVYRYFASIQLALRREIYARADGEMTGDHILLIGLGAAMVSQLLAAIPDFPFHRIETAVYAVLFMGLVPVLTESDFFSRPIVRKHLHIDGAVGLAFAMLTVVASLSAAYYEHRCWRADEMVRQADMYMRYTQPEAVNMSKTLLLNAIQLDPLPGDPYLKLSALYEQEKDGERALVYADKSMQNINFNARSTYHSVVFRKLHIYYHLLNKLVEAYQAATYGIDLTAGEARSVYYMYAGKIALDITRYNIPEDRRADMLKQAETFLTKALKFPAFELQARASLAVIMAGIQRWQEALDYAASVSVLVADRDPTMLNIIGIAASNLGDQNRAEVNIKKAIELHPENMVYKRDLGVIYVRSNKLDQARTQLEEAALALSSPPEIKQHATSLVASITEAELNMARNLLSSGKEAEATPYLNSLMKARMVDAQLKGWAESQLVKINRLPAEHIDLPAEKPDSVFSVPVNVPASSVPPIYQMPVNSQP